MIVFCNSASYNGASAYTAAAEDPVVRSLPWLLRLPVPGYVAGWPPQ